MEQYSNIELLTEPSASNHVITVGYGDAHYAALEHSHTLSEITDAAAELATLATKSELAAAVNGINLTLVSDYDTSDEISALYATKAALTAYVKTTEMNSALTAYVTSQNLGTILESYALTATLANYATSASVSQLRNYVDSTFASVTTVRGMIEGALTGYVSPSSLEAALANYAPVVHTHTSAQISDATRTGGQNADAGKAVLLSDGGKIAGAMVPVDGASIVLANGTISVSDSWLAGEVHDYTKKEVSSVSGTVINLTESGQVFDKSLSADATITLNTSELVLDAGEVVEFDLSLTLGAGVTAHLPGWMTGNGPLYNYAEEGKTLFHVWSYDGGTTWNASKESWLPPDNWKWVTTLSDAIGHQGTSLRDAVGAASEGDVIKFIPELEGTITLEQGEIGTIRQISIEGNGKITIDGNNQSRIFYCSSKPVILKGLTFINGQAEADGGAVYAMKGLTATDCKFIGNKVGIPGGTKFPHGGAISVTAGDLTLTDCLFENNYGVGQVNGIYGGAVFFSNNTITLTRCKFKGNTAEIDGGNDQAYGTVALYTPTAVEITDCEFIDETATFGVLYIVRNMTMGLNETPYTISQCKFSGGQAVRGGAINFYYINAEITDCEFISNTSAGIGGAICSDRENILSFVGCSFSGNQAAAQGGVLATYGVGSPDFSLEGCSFTNNISGSYGGVVALGGTSNLTTVAFSDCKFIGNQAGTYATLYLVCKEVSVSGCEFIDSVNSPCIQIYGRQEQTGYTVDRCLFKNTSKPGAGELNVIAVTAMSGATGAPAVVDVSDSVFIQNKGTSGNCLKVEGTSSITSRGCTFMDNENMRSVRATSGTIHVYNGVDIGNTYGPSVVSGQTLTIDYYLIDQTLTGENYTNIITYDDSLPLFAEDGYTPVEGSQVIDAGNSEYVESETDINGNTRIVGEAVDLGAVEYQGNAAALTLNRLNVIRNLNRMNLNSLNIDSDGIEEELALEPELEQELNGGDQR